MYMNMRFAILYDFLSTTAYLTYYWRQLPSRTVNESPKKTNANKFIRKKGQTTTNPTGSNNPASNSSADRSDIPTHATAGSNTNSAMSALSLETTYAPNVQSDYGGNIFQHQYSRLRQLPVYNTDGDLVPTQNLWKELRPGTLVTLNADLVCWIYDDKDKRRKVNTLTQ